MSTSTAGRVVVGGAELAFETLDAARPALAPLRILGGEETLLRVVAGTVGLEIAGAAWLLGPQEEARIAPGVPHRLWNAGEGMAKIVRQLRAAS